MSHELDEFTRAYLECAFWSSMDEADEQGGAPLDQNYSIDDLAPEALQQAIDDCQRFQTENVADLLRLTDWKEWSASELAGHDFWLTRNHHGSGFWDNDRWPKDVCERLTTASHAFGECSLYVGDDGRIYHFSG